MISGDTLERCRPFVETAEATRSHADSGRNAGRSCGDDPRRLWQAPVRRSARQGSRGLACLNRRRSRPGGVRAWQGTLCALSRKSPRSAASRPLIGSEYRYDRAATRSISRRSDLAWRDLRER
jgi:hypothetical protein